MTKVYSPKINVFFSFLSFYFYVPPSSTIRTVINALRDVQVTVPQAVKRGDNAILYCRYDMEDDTLYSVKWYKGRREFYRYTPKENPAMKIFQIAGVKVEVS